MGAYPAGMDPRAYDAAGSQGAAGVRSNGMVSGGQRNVGASSSTRGLAPTALTYVVQPAPPSYSEVAPATYTLFAGTIIPAMLITGINSDLAGDILAQVSRDVYSSDQRALVIPQGKSIDRPLR
jgi:type IV secretion system protein VirB10